jgi:flagellar M-ring protein FliF
LRKNEIEMKIKVSLSPLFDAVTVINDNLKFNWDKSVETSQIITPPIVGSDTGVIMRENSDKLSEQGTTGGQAPGVGANDQQTPTYQTQNGGASSSNRKTESAEYGYNQTQRTVESASGALVASESTIAVLVYRNRMYRQEAMEGQLSGQSWEAFKSSVNEAALDIDFEPIRDIIAKGTGLSSENISVHGYEVPVFADSPAREGNPAQIMMFVVLGLLLLMLLFGLLSKMPPAEVVEIEPELSVEDLLETTKREDEKEEAKLKEIDYSKVSESKKMIDKFVSEKPEAVAQLLRNWLNDNWE